MLVSFVDITGTVRIPIVQVVKKFQMENLEINRLLFNYPIGKECNRMKLVCRHLKEKVSSLVERLCVRMVMECFV